MSGFAKWFQSTRILRQQLGTDRTRSRANCRTVSILFVYLIMKRGEFSDFKAARAGGNGNHNFIAFFFSHQAAANRRHSRNKAGSGIAFFGSYQTVSDFLLALGVIENER